MKQIKAILFDLDGVLVDATEWHYLALNRALALFGYAINHYEHLSTYNGLPTGKKLEMLSIEKGLPPALHALIKRLKQKFTREEILSNCSPAFDKEFMIRRLKREGYRIAVCSNAIRESVDLMLRSTALLEEIEFFLSNEDVKNPKPSPEIFVEAFKKLSLDPQEVVIVEDAGPGVEAARRSGAHLCRVAGFDHVNYFLIKEFINRIESKNESKQVTV